VSICTAEPRSFQNAPAPHAWSAMFSFARARPASGRRSYEMWHCGRSDSIKHCEVSGHPLRRMTARTRRPYNRAYTPLARLVYPPVAGLTSTSHKGGLVGQAGLACVFYSAVCKSVTMIGTISGSLEAGRSSAQEMKRSLECECIGLLERFTC
jgi:hypothetical protein